MSVETEIDRLRPMVALAVIVLLVLAIGGCSMRQMIYPAPHITVGEPPADMEEATLGSGGESIVAWYWEPPEVQYLKPALLFLHGNGENLETIRASNTLEQLRQLGSPFLIIDYPGYGRSSGRPSESSLKRAAADSIRWLSDRTGERRIVVCGWSLGAAVGVHVAATESSVDALIAMSAWTSLSDVAELHFPRWLVGTLLRETYDSADSGSRITIPTLLIHGTKDPIIPVAQGHNLASKIPHAEWFEVPTSGHNDLLSYSEVWSVIAEFLDRVRAVPAV